jgi:SOS response regulatory protein OraA/RecX
LKAKGIADDLIAAALAKHLNTEEQAHMCQRVLAKKLRTSDIGLDRPQIRKKIHRFLFNRGFSPDTIQQAISDQLKRM